MASEVKLIGNIRRLISWHCPVCDEEGHIDSAFDASSSHKWERYLQPATDAMVQSIREHIAVHE